MPENEVQLSARLSLEDGLVTMNVGKLTLIPSDEESARALRRLTEAQMGDDHSKTLLLAELSRSDGAVSFEIFTGPDVSATEQHMKELYLYRAPDDQIQTQPTEAPTA